MYLLPLYSTKFYSGIAIYILFPPLPANAVTVIVPLTFVIVSL